MLGKGRPSGCMPNTGSAGTTKKHFARVVSVGPYKFTRLPNRPNESRHCRTSESVKASPAKKVQRSADNETGFVRSFAQVWASVGTVCKIEICSRSSQAAICSDDSCSSGSGRQRVAPLVSGRKISRNTTSNESPVSWALRSAAVIWNCSRCHFRKWLKPL